MQAPAMHCTTRHRATRTQPARPVARQQGVTLIELMVGIAIGLMVVAVALGALMASRGITGTVSEATALQQQAAYAFRVIGQQIRQAGSIELNLNPSIVLTPASGANAAMSPVAFDAPRPCTPALRRASGTINGVTTPLQRHRGLPELHRSHMLSDPTHIHAARLPGAKPCTRRQRQPGRPCAYQQVRAQCRQERTGVHYGAGGSDKQALIGNVTDMQVRYVEQAPGTTTLKYLPSSPLPSNWSNIYAIEVCLELTGTEPVPTSGATYKNCSGTDTSYGDRLKMVFRNVFQLRSQGSDLKVKGSSMHSPSSTARPAAPHRERGIALFVVIVFVMLSMLLALWASRTAIFNEMVVGNDADYQRAFEAAQSLIQDAELDIQQFDTTGYRADDNAALTAVYDNNIVGFSNERSTSPFCENGLCVKRRGRQDFWNNHTDTTEADDHEVSFEQMTRANNAGKRFWQCAPRYGELITRASSKNPLANDRRAYAQRHPLADRDSADDRGGWYWIEVLSYADPDAVGGAGLIVNDDPNAAAPTDLLDLRLKPSVVYRITAWAKGLNPNSTAVIQETYARTRLQD